MNLKQAISWAEDRKINVTYQSPESSLIWYVFKSRNGYVIYSSNEVERFKMENWVYRTK